MRALGLLLAALAVFLALRSLTAPPPGWKLPYLEIHPTLSRDGNLVAFEIQRAVPDRVFGRRDRGEGTDLMLIDLKSGKATRFPPGQPDGSSYQPCLSSDGRQVAFISEASNLVSDDRNSVADVFVWDRHSNKIRRVAPPREVAGESTSFWPSLGGERVGYSTFGSEGSERRFVLQDLRRPSPRLCPLDAPAYGKLAFSPDGARAAGTFYVPPGGLHVDLFEIMPGSRWSQPARVTAGADGPSHGPALSATSCVLATLATNLVPGTPAGHYNVLALGLDTGRWELVAGGNDASLEPAISDDGETIVFSSYASDLVEGDSNGLCDVFLRRGATTRLLSRGGDGPSYNPCLSGDGSTVAFASRATNLVAAPVPPGQVYIWKSHEIRCVTF